MTVTKTVYRILDDMQECNISGWRLFDMVHRETGKHSYPSTILDICRKYADITGSDFECIDRTKSIYHFKPNIRLGNAAVVSYE